MEVLGFSPMKKLSTVTWVCVATVVGACLYLLSLSTAHSLAFERWQLWLIAANVAVAVLITVLIGINLFRLRQGLHHEASGARLTRRLVVLFSALSLLPVGAVFYFSIQFINHGIDSWFNPKVNVTLNDALILSRRALASQTGPYAGATAQAARMLAQRGPEPLETEVDRLRTELGAVRVAVYNRAGLQVNSAEISPKAPPLPKSFGGQYPKTPIASLYVSHTGALFVLARAPMPDPPTNQSWLATMYPVGGATSALARRVESGFLQYRELSYLRAPLKVSFTLTLTLVLLLSLLVAVWAAFLAANRVVNPIQSLLRATRAVAEGDFSVKVAEQSGDEIGFLARSFNRMTAGLAATRAQADRVQLALERERTWLASVFGALPNGIITLDSTERLLNVNAAAAAILDLSPERWQNEPLNLLLSERPDLAPVFSAERRGESRDIEIRLSSGERTLRVGVTEVVDGESRRGGWVLVVEDVSEFLHAQREAAWGEVARRLAHEIKNPLTPIQLAAERLRVKCFPESNEQRLMLERATTTIINQVQSMQTMVDAFSEYAKAPGLRLEEVDIRIVVREVVELYRARTDMVLTIRAAEELPAVRGDPARIRQILHNLIKNAIEAQDEEEGVALADIELNALPIGGVMLSVHDRGPGFSPSVLARAFEPYVTTKHKGTGLGLALVRRFAEEQGARIWIENRPGGGASVKLHFQAT